MKILYGVQGTGNGHLSRARQLGPELIKLGAQIDWVMSGRARDEYFDMAEFNDFQTYQGLSFQVKNGKIELWKTWQKLQLKQCISDINQLDTRQYDLVISDYEPITAWAARRQKTPSLGLAHQYAFLHPSVPKIGHHWVGNALLKYFAPTQLTLGLHWHHFDAPILPPIFGVSGNLEAAQPDASQVLVYLPHDSIAQLLPIFNAHPNYQWHVFTQEVTPQQIGSVHIHALSRPVFLQKLHQSTHVLCAAGFELVSEALSLGRNILVKPLQQQTEQIANAKALSLLEYATVTHRLDLQTVQQWLYHGRIVRVNYPNVAHSLAQKIMQGRWETLSTELIDLWRDCSMPDPSWLAPTSIESNRELALTEL